MQLLSSPTLKILNLAANQIQGTGLGQISTNHQLEWLYLDRNLIDDSGVQSLGKNECLKLLSISDNRLGDVGVARISELLPSLILLNLGNNCVSDQGATALARHHALQTLNLLENTVHYEGAIALLQITSLQCLTLAFNQVAGELEVFAAHNQKSILVELAGNPICTTFTRTTEVPSKQHLAPPSGLHARRLLRRGFHACASVEYKESSMYYSDLRGI